MPQLSPEQLMHIALAHHQNGQLDSAISAYQAALQLNPNLLDAHNNLGAAYHAQGNTDSAIASFRRAIACDPARPNTHNNLGLALQAKGDDTAALLSYHEALRLDPAFADAHMNLANILKAQGHIDEATAAYRQAVRLNPNHAEAAYNLGTALQAQGFVDEAIACYGHALQLRPDFWLACNTLGSALKDQGLLDQAIQCHRRTLSHQPANPTFHSMLIYAMEYAPSTTPQSLFEECRRWNQNFALPLRPLIQPHTNTRDPDRRLRIGYISPDFRQHVIARFLHPLLASHDPNTVEVFCYSDVQAPDSMTARLRAHAAHWRSIWAQSDDHAASLIRNDGIDILIDLTMHTWRNRLLLFARKPAPIQATYLSYCSTTGLDAIDYRLTDPFMDPPPAPPTPSDAPDPRYSEKSIRLESYWCYAETEPAPPVNDLPALATHQITFGCLNNFCKVSPAALDTWSQILLALPNSRLLLHAPPGTHRRRVLQHLASKGLNPSRCQFIGFLPAEDYFRTYHQIDIALDPFPFGGGTTSFDALRMGVPLITLAGQRAVGRGGTSILSLLNLPDLIAPTPEAYIQIALTLAHDTPRLSALRSTLRQRLHSSPLMDAPRFARTLESAYRAMWQRWCAGGTI